MKHLIAKISSALAITMVSLAVSAAPINGEFSISGGAAPSGGPTMGTATGITFIAPIALFACVGDVATILGGTSCSGATATTMNNIAAGSIPGGSGGVTPYLNTNWINVDAGKLTFSITGITSYFHGTNSILVEGIGLMESNTAGWMATPGTFSITAQGATTSFSFSATPFSSGAVPLPGSMALLGLGLVGAAVARKARAKK
jgi:PEP-CTERM motif